MNKSKWFVVLLSAVMLAAGFGCMSLSEYVTPATIDPRAVDYVTRAGVDDPNKYVGYANLAKAMRLGNAVDDAHETMQLVYSQLSESDQLKYGQIKDTTAANLVMAREREELLFGETGLLTLGLSLAGFGSLTGLVGLMRKRPGDMTPEEIKRALAGQDAVLSGREKQIVELIQGVEDYINTYPDAASKIKDVLSKRQSAGTKALVGEVTANL